MSLYKYIYRWSYKKSLYSEAFSYNKKQFLIINEKLCLGFNFKRNSSLGAIKSFIIKLK